MDANCDLLAGGICALATTGNRWCAYPDEMCPDGYRYAENAGDDLSENCVKGSTLTLALGGNGRGQVTADIAGFACSDGTCVGKFPEGTLVRLSAVASMGSFLGWTQACRGKEACELTMDGDRIVGALFGTPGEALWSKQIGSISSDEGHGIAIDSEDNIITIGGFSGAIVPAPGMELQSGGGTDIFVMKLASSSGEVLWAKRLGGAMDDMGSSVTVDSNNNIYVTGIFKDTVDFGNGPRRASGASGAVFVLKLQTNGDFAWVRQVDATALFTSSGARARIAADDEAVVIASAFNGSITVDTPTGTTTFTGAGLSDFFVLKIAASNGETVWVKPFGGTRVDSAGGIAIDSERNVVLTGDFVGTINLGGNDMSSSGGDFSNAFLLKLAADGVHLFSKSFGGVRTERGEALVVDTSNNILIAGAFGATIDFGCANKPAASEATPLDIFVAKFSQAGACQWAKGFGGTGNTRNAYGIAVNSAGDVAIAGGFCGIVSFGGQMLMSASNCLMGDVFAARFADDGTHLNSIRAGGVGDEVGREVAQSSDGRFFAIGEFQGFAEFGKSAYSAVGGTDAFIVALAPL